MAQKSAEPQDQKNTINSMGDLDNNSVDEVPSTVIDYGTMKLTQERYELNEKRVMRSVVFAIVIFFAIEFLWAGLNMAQGFFENIKDVKEEVAKSLPQIPFKIESKESVQGIKSLLSAGSVITLIAFVLGVGLTLLLTIIRAIFSENRLNDSKAKTIIADIATPLNKLIEALIDKLLKRK